MIDLDEDIRKGEVMARFLGDDIIKQVFRDMDTHYTNEMKAADTPAERESAWAKARALNDLSRVLQGVVQSGQSATHQLEQRAKPQIA